MFTARPLSGTPDHEQRDPRGRVGRARQQSMRCRWIAPCGCGCSTTCPGESHAAPGLTGCAVRRLGVRRRQTPPPRSAPSARSPSGSFCSAASIAARRCAPRTQRRSQAVKVSAWVEAQRTAQGGREVLFFVHNASDMPIYEVSLPTPDEGRRRSRVHRPRPTRPDHPTACPAGVAGHLLRPRTGRDRVPRLQRPAVDPQRTRLASPPPATTTRRRPRAGGGSGSFEDRADLGRLRAQSRGAARAIDRCTTWSAG